MGHPGLLAGRAESMREAPGTLVARQDDIRLTECIALAIPAERSANAQLNLLSSHAEGLLPPAAASVPCSCSIYHLADRTCWRMRYRPDNVTDHGVPSLWGIGMDAGDQGQPI